MEKLVYKTYSLSDCLEKYNKMLDEGRNVFWGQYPEGWYEITEVDEDEDKRSNF